MSGDLQSRSFWLGLDPYVPNEPLEQDLKVDVAIVGGGFTGLWTSYLLLRRNPGMRLAILEKQAIGYGASGRNGGFAMTLVHRTLSHLARYVGDEAARKIYAAAANSVQHINEIVATESIACDLQSNGLLTLSNSEAQDRIIEQEFETAQRLGIKEITFLSGAEAQAQIHSEHIRCAIREERCSLVNPARLARGLKRVVERLGGTVYEGCSVQSWEENAGGVTLRIDGRRRYSVRAERAVIAPNAYGTTWRRIRPYVLPFYSYICLTAPLSDAQWGSVGWRGREGAEDRRAFLHYFRPTADGRILWGGRDAVFRPDGPKRFYDRNLYVFGRMRETFEWFFPQLKDVPFEHRWGGPIGITGDFLPKIGFFDSRKRRAAYAYGYNGHGVAISHLAAHAVADLFAGKQTGWTDLPFVGQKRRSLGPRFLRDPLVRRTAKAQLRADDENRELRDPWVLRLLNLLTGSDLKLN